MSVATFTKTGSKATTAAKLNKDVFGQTVESHDLVKQVYIAHLANGRENYAVTLKRGEVSGGGRKPWKQKGTGRARFGSSRNIIWRGGGIAFGPSGNENYSKKVTTAMNKKALTQALSLKQDAIKVIENLDPKTSKTSEVAKLLSKIEANGRVLLVVDNRSESLNRATSNIQNLKLTAASYVNVYDVMNADCVVMTKQALDVVHEWLGGKK